MFRVDGTAAFLRMLSRVDKAINAEVRDASGALASDFITGAVSRAPTRQNRAALQSLTVARDRVPAVRSRLAWFYGAEFGGGRRRTTRQFPDYRGSTGIGLYPYIRSEGARLADDWAEAIFDVIDRRWHD